MIARLSLLLLLANSAIVTAQPLYKWQEADGSITFSPTPPTNGVPFETLTTGTGTASTPGTSAMAEAVRTTSAEDGEPNAPDPIRHAPGSEGNLPPALSHSRASAGNPPPLSASATALAVTRSADTTNTANTLSDESVHMSAASFKRSRCEDLRKRVTSLEQRLRQPLTPEDMDNTVVHMARYQRSHDQYCVQ